ncbi:MAG: uridine kinase [Deltaproteobacteria bacterium]|nr:uridine kinase [Deltaproteobacteria bacterium]
MYVTTLGIAGPSGAGKTTLAQALAQSLAARGPVVFQLDAYYRDLAALPPARRAAENFDVPGALDWELLVAQLRRLQAGQAVEQPVYDFARHTRDAGVRPLAPGGLLIVEGLHALHDRLRPWLDLKIFVDLDQEACLARRLARDTATRGRSAAGVRQQFAATVRPMFEAHVAPLRAWADVVVAGDRPPAQAVARVTARLAGRVPAREAGA